MKSNVKVSVVTPVYNGEETIKDTIEAVLNQTYSDIEYIIVDGKSEDSTMEIVQKYEPLFEGRLKYVSEKDSGIYNAMNKGIRMATGQIIGIINADDFYEPDTVEKVVAHMTESKCQVIYGYMREFRRGGLNYVIKAEADGKKMIPHPTCFVSRDVYKEYGMYNEKFRIAADYDFILRVSGKENVEFIQIKEILANFRYGGVSSSRFAIVESTLVRTLHGIGSVSDFLKQMAEYFVIRGITVE